MDFDKIALSRIEFKALKILRKSPVLLEKQTKEPLQRLIHLQLAESFRTQDFKIHSQIGVQISDEGKDYLMYRRAERWSFVRRSILVPIAVAFVTAILTTDIWPSVKAAIIAFLQSMIR